MLTGFVHKPGLFYRVRNRLSGLALLPVLLLMALVALPVPAEAATPVCSPAAPPDENLRKSLQGLPPAMKTILRAVRSKRKALCALPDSSIAVDPLPVSVAAVPPAEPDPRDTVPDEVVALVPGNGANIDTIAGRNGLTVRARRRSALLGGFIVRFGINDGRTPAQVSRTLQADPATETVAPNHIYRLQGSVYEEARFAPKKIGMPVEGFGLSGKNVRIGIIDTAVDPDHPDLRGAIIDRFDALAGQKINNRRHGTAVAGLIAGRAMIHGVAPKAGLLIARAFDEPDKDSGHKASATSAQLLECLEWTVRKGAHIINMSFAGPRNALMTRALDTAAKKNILLIAAAGNNGPNAPAAWPAAEQSVLAVTAVDVNNRIYSKANTGPWVFVAAPGVDILVAAPEEGIDLVSGTSFAAPFVSGLAALMLEQNIKLTPRQFAVRITRSARDLGRPGRDEIFGVGLADLRKALNPR